MDFNEMKRIWDTQNNEHVYAINEEALHRRVKAKKSRAAHTANISEIILIVSNLVAGGMLVASKIIPQQANIFTYLLAAVMFIAAAYVIISRYRRHQWQNRFDLTMLGELEQAIANATYQVRLSQTMRWYILPVAALTLLAIWYNDISAWKWLLILAFFALGYFATGKEHNYYASNKRRLEQLREMLTKEQ